MSIQTSTGVKIYISTQLPATFDLAGYGALTWTEIKEVTNIVPPSPSYQVVTHEPLKTGITQKNKGFVDYGDPTIDYALDTSDTGQQMLQSAASGATKNLEHSFKLTYPNGDIRYFSGRVFSSLEGGFSANSMVSGTSNVGVSRAIVKIPAISFAANYITNTYSILGESKTFADSHTFTRSTTATFVGSNGLIQSAAIDAPRFTYDPVTLAPKGLLIEGSRTNLLTYSERFDNAVWIKTEATISADVTTAPDGTTTGDKLVESGLAGPHFVQEDKSNTLGSGNSFVISVFAKASGRSVLQLVGSEGASEATGYVNFDLSSGVISDGNLISNANIENYGSGWYRCSLLLTADSDPQIRVICAIANSPTATRLESYTGDGTSGIYIWGAQLEVGLFASSYIPTTTAQVTRTADVCTAKEFTSWYNQGEGSVFVDAEAVNSNIEATSLVQIDNGSDSNRIFLSGGLSGQTLIQSRVSNVISDVLISGQNKKTSAKYSQSNLSISIDGGLASAANTVGLPTATNMKIGRQAVFTDRLYGTIAELNYYPTALSDEALQDLTR